MSSFAPHWLALALLTPLLPAWGVLEQRGHASAALKGARVSSMSGDRLAAGDEPAILRSFRVSGRVVDPYGDPIADAEVWLENMDTEGGAPAPVWLGTDSDGRFNAPDVRTGLYTLTGRARGFDARAIAVEVHADSPDLRLALVSAPSPRAVVVDPDGHPVSDAVVVACTEIAEVTLRSAPDGTVLFGSGAIGCAATAHHSRFAHSAPVRLGGQGIATLRLGRGGSIEGVVTDPSGRAIFDGEISVFSFGPSEDELPLAGVVPELEFPVGREFRFSGLAPGTYILAVRRHARGGGTQDVTELGASSFEVVAGRVVRGVHIVAEPSEDEPPLVVEAAPAEPAVLPAEPEATPAEREATPVELPFVFPDEAEEGWHKPFLRPRRRYAPASGAGLEMSAPSS